MMNKNYFYVVRVGKNGNGTRFYTLDGDVKFDTEVLAFRFAASNAINAGCNSMAEAVEKFAVIEVPADFSFAQVVDALKDINDAVDLTPKCNCPGCANKRAAAQMSGVKNDPMGDLLGALFGSGIDVLIDILKDAKSDVKRGN